RGAGSSISADLQLSLASRLRALMDVDGSPEYELTWNQWDMPWGPPICRLRASERRTSGNGCGGWPTPRANDGTGDKIPPGRQGGVALKTMAGWATPTARDYRSEKASDDYNQKREAHPRGKPLAYQALGAMPSGSPVPTERRGALNPAWSPWLVGFPEGWLACGVRAMQSCRRLRRCS